MDAAGVALEHDALVILFFDEGKALSIRAQPRESIEKFRFRQIEKRGDAGDFLFLQPHITRPLAAGGAALANVVGVRLEDCLTIAGAAMGMCGHQRTIWR